MGRMFSLIDGGVGARRSSAGQRGAAWGSAGQRGAAWRRLLGVGWAGRPASECAFGQTFEFIMAIDILDTRGRIRGHSSGGPNVVCVPGPEYSTCSGHISMPVRTGQYPYTPITGRKARSLQIPMSTNRILPSIRRAYLLIPYVSSICAVRRARPTPPPPTSLQAYHGRRKLHLAWTNR